MQLLLADFIESMFSVPGIIFTVGGAIAIVAIVCWSVTEVVTSRSREKTKREIAAYVAEGTIDPDKAVQMLKASGGKDEET